MHIRFEKENMREGRNVFTEWLSLPDVRNVTIVKADNNNLYVAFGVLSCECHISLNVIFSNPSPCYLSYSHYCCRIGRNRLGQLLNAVFYWEEHYNIIPRHILEEQM